MVIDNLSLLLSTGDDISLSYPCRVPWEGLEPSTLAGQDSESCAYTNSATTAI